MFRVLLIMNIIPSERFVNVNDIRNRTINCGFCFEIDLKCIVNTITFHFDIPEYSRQAKLKAMIMIILITCRHNNVCVFYCLKTITLWAT